MSNINKHSERFTQAVTKLYNAFHKGELNAMNACCCAIGNLCDLNSGWRQIIPTKTMSYSIPLEWQIYTGYSQIELYNIESTFMRGTKNHTHKHIVNWHPSTINNDNKEGQFKALCAVVEYLCELEGIPNIMDYTCLFETENNEPKHQLQEVFV